MPVPTWNVGQVLAAADVNSWFVPVAAIKLNDTSRSNTTLVNDPDLQVAFAAGASYLFQCYLMYTAANGGDIQWDFTGLSAATLRYAPMRQNISGAWAGAFADTGSTVENANGQGTSLMNASLFGTLHTTTTAGTLILQWAQNTSSGTATVLKAQSCLCLQRIA